MIIEENISFEFHLTEWYKTSKTCTNASSLSACSQENVEENSVSNAHRFLLLLNSWEKLSWATVGCAKIRCTTTPN